MALAGVVDAGHGDFHRRGHRQRFDHVGRAGLVLHFDRLRVGADKAAEVAASTLDAMYERMGFARP